MKILSKVVLVVLAVFWALYLLLEILVWYHTARAPFIPYHPISDMVFNVLNDTIWVPIAYALPFYLAALLTKVTKFAWIKILCFLFGTVLFILGLSDPGRYFMYLFYLLVPFFALFIYYIVTFKKLRINILVFAGVLLVLVLHYRAQLVPNIHFPRSTDSIKIMSYNILVNQYGRKRQETIELVRREQPDVVFFQEINLHDRKLLNQSLKDIYPHQVWSEKFETYNGGVIFSKYPLVAKKNYDIKTPYMKGHINLNHAVINYHGKNIHLFNCHLYNSANLFLGLLLNRIDYAQFMERADNAQKRHRMEATRISEIVLPLHEPLIFAGDFNDTPNSSTYQLYAGSLQNAFARAGWGIGGTFGYMSLRKSVPQKLRFLLYDFLRIDHIFCSQHFSIESARVLNFDASDHRPQIVEVRLK